MSVVEIELADEEDVIRVYTRWPNQTWCLTKLGPKDFARIMPSHSGISLWRIQYIVSREDVMAKLETEKLKGTAVCKGKSLKALGLKFFSSSINDPHISARCPGCDLNTNYGLQLCKMMNGSSCGLDLHAEFSLAKTLAHKTIFTIDVPIQI